MNICVSRQANFQTALNAIVSVPYCHWWRLEQDHAWLRGMLSALSLSSSSRHRHHHHHRHLCHCFTGPMFFVMPNQFFLPFATRPGLWGGRKVRRLMGLCCGCAGVLADLVYRCRWRHRSVHDVVITQSSISLLLYILCHHHIGLHRSQSTCRSVCFISSSSSTR